MGKKNFYLIIYSITSSLSAAKRIMYGTDLMIWPRLLETSLGVIENANYLFFDQKRDILFNNAGRFFRLDASKYQ